MKEEIKEFKDIINRLHEISESPNFSDIMRNNAVALQYYIKHHTEVKPEPQPPIIVKSGETWVAEWNGINYLCIDHKRSGFLEEDFVGTFICDWWKPFSEIEITDDIAKLRPMVKTDYTSSLSFLWAVDKNGICHFEGGGCSRESLCLATVKELTNI